jgi:hypothetical protein
MSKLSQHTSGGKKIMIDLPQHFAKHVDRFIGRAWLLPKLLEWWEEGVQRLLS